MSALKKPVYRHELKYFINHPERILLKQRLGGLLVQDENARETGEYKIRSLYFDDYWKSAYEEKLMGTCERTKYRIRTYNDGDKDIYLERKNKFGEYISKERGALTREEVYRILDGDYAFLEKSNKQLCQEFYYECMNRMMRPRVIVDYEREPYTFLPGDVRITFDRNIRAASLNFDIFDKDLPTHYTMEPEQLILEVKFTEFLPNMIKRILPSRSADRSAASKFVFCCDQMSNLYER